MLSVVDANEVELSLAEPGHVLERVYLVALKVIAVARHLDSAQPLVHRLPLRVRRALGRRADELAHRIVGLVVGWLLVIESALAMLGRCEVCWGWQQVVVLVSELICFPEQIERRLSIFLFTLPILLLGKKWLFG